MTSWRPMLRIARRDALRARGRSLLVLLMIALPVLTVTAADVVIHTVEVSGAEALDRRLGAADARVEFPGVKTVLQAPDPDLSGTSLRGEAAVPTTLATASEALGRPVRGVRWREGSIRVNTGNGVTSATATETDLSEPLAEGLFRLVEGRLPEQGNEVVVNSALAERGADIGETLDVAGDAAPMIVGIAESTTYRAHPIAAGPLDSFGFPDSTEKTSTWLVDAGGPVTWQDVRLLNEHGAIVLSRAVIETPPPPSQVPVEDYSSSGDEAVFAVVALIVVMALLELVLLAGPAFAVGARKQQRTLALIAATGGTPRQMRRVVLASAVVLGGVAAAVGVFVGIAAAVAVLPIAQRFSGEWLGPFQVPWLHLVGIAAFGLLSAFLAAVVPAVLAARQDVVSVLAGRRGDGRPSLRSPLLGAALLAAGTATATYGAVARGSGEFYIAGSAVLSVLGMLLLIPVVVTTLARFSRRLPLPIRYAVRDAARHRTRTVPAVAAVAATVVGVVALSIGAASDELESQRTYSPLAIEGTGMVSWHTRKTVDTAPIEEAVHRALPASHVTSVRGITEWSSRNEGESVYVEFRAPDGPRRLLDGSTTLLGSSVLVGDTLPGGLLELDSAQRDAVSQVLAAGGAAVLTSRPVPLDQVSVSARYWSKGESAKPEPGIVVPAVYLEIPGAMAPAQAVVSPQVADRLKLDPANVGLVVEGPISAAAEADIQEAAGAVSPNAHIYVERGYQGDDEAAIVLAVLAAVGAVLMLGGTLTATSLALSDAQPDLATLAAIGAAPRTRRAVAAAYAGTIGLVGALLGAAVGFIPGIAVTYPLTSVTWMKVDAEGRPLPDHFLDIPWLLLGGIVVLLPLLTALLVGLTVRSRLGLAARVE